MPQESQRGVLRPRVDDCHDVIIADGRQGLPATCPHATPTPALANPRPDARHSIHERSRCRRLDCCWRGGRGDSHHRLDHSEAERAPARLREDRERDAARIRATASPICRSQGCLPRLPVPAEALFDLLAQYVRPGKISQYEAALEMTSVVAEHVPEAEPGPEPANPLPDLDPDGQEARTLRELTTSMRTQRVMVALVGSGDVSEAALGFERSMRVATGAVLSRDAVAALDFFLEAAGGHEAFITEAKKGSRLSIRPRPSSPSSNSQDLWMGVSCDLLMAS